jgi:hypothetical protein
MLTYAPDSEYLEFPSLSKCPGRLTIEMGKSMNTAFLVIHPVGRKITMVCPVFAFW